MMKIFLCVVVVLAALMASIVAVAAPPGQQVQVTAQTLAVLQMATAPEMAKLANSTPPAFGVDIGAAVTTKMNVALVAVRPPGAVDQSTGPVATAPATLAERWRSSAPTAIVHGAVLASTTAPPATAMWLGTKTATTLPGGPMLA